MGRKRKAAKAEGNANANANDSFNNSPVESMENVQDVQTSPIRLPSKQKGPKDANGVIRRSGRLRSLHAPVPNEDTTVEEIDLVTDEQEDEPLDEQMNSEMPPTDLQRLESKIDFLVQSVEEFKSEGARRPFQSETPPSELRYRSLYIESQKKIEELTQESIELGKKLEFAKGKVEAFEQVNVALGNLKGMALMTNFGRAAETLLNFCSQPATLKFNAAEEAPTLVAPAPAPVPPPPPPPLAAAENNNSSDATRKKYARRKK